MPDILSATILGAVQGLSEFLPISSSGHLILVRDALGITIANPLAFDVVLHVATALAVVLYFRTDIWGLITNALEERNKRLWGALIIGTIPAAVVGFFFQDTIETVLRSTHVVVFALLGGSVLFVLAEQLATHHERLSVGKGWWIGLYQALALIPGVSRSGASISGGLLFGMSREEATRFAFLLSFPVVIGAGFLKFIEVGEAGLSGVFGIPLLVGGIVAFVIGYGAIHFMVTFLKNHTLYGFALYRVLLAILVLLVL